MPFTIAHAAIMLPFKKIDKEYISLSTLIIGSITPDFEYFIKMKLSGRYSHSIEGIFLFDLPVAIILALLFHRLIKVPIIDNLPRYFSSRLQSLKNFDFLNYVSHHYYGFIFCLLIGISSHVVWDSFTHPHEFFVTRWGLLSSDYSFPGLPAVKVYWYLQHTSTAAGFIVIAWVFHRMPVTSCIKIASSKFWLIITGISISVFVLRALMGFEYLGDIVATAISALCIGITVACIIPRSMYG